MPVASLEVSLFRRDAGSFGIELRFTAPDSEQEKIRSGTTPLRADDPEFRARSFRSTQEH
jgi:hypothetical protein